MTDFPGFFEALWKSDKWPSAEPFPWQVMLAEQAAGGDWPRVISLPTASGKTACLDVAVFALAATARPDTGKRMPRRIWFVVDRRIVVDEAFRRAQAIAAALGRAERGPLKEVAEILCELGGCSRPLRVARLRGGAWRDDGWARLPSQPSIICSTVDQIGSALLFRAYGHSDETASIYAGLAAHDSLIVLDEAHCAVPFMQTLHAVARFRDEPWAEQPLKTPFHYCVMSATPPGDTPDEVVFPSRAKRAAALDHPLLQRRLTARKFAELVVVEDRTGEFASEAAKQALRFAVRGQRRRVAVMVNRVAMAEEIAARLRMDSDAADVLLLTGRMRPLDRDALVSHWEDRLKAGSAEPLEKPVIVVTTQCLEVGADFSFDALVTECASLDALRQRFGRLDRLGQLGTTSAVILIRANDSREPENGGDPVYGHAIYETWTWLNEPDQRQPDGTVDFGVSAINGRIDALRKQDALRFLRLLAPAPDAPVLLPAHLDLLCQTSPHPVPEPDVALFLHGKGRQAHEVRVVFRADLADDDEDASVETLSLIPPTSPEMLTVPFHRLRRWLIEQEPEEQGDVEGAREDGHLDRKQVARVKFVIWRGRERSTLTDDIDRVRPNDIVVLRLSARGFEGLGQSIDSAQGLGPSCLDLAERSGSQTRGRVVLRIRRDVLQPMCDCAPIAHLVELASGAPEQDEIVAGLDAVLVENAATEPPFLPEWLKEIVTNLRDAGFRMESHPAGGLVLIGRQQRCADELTEDDPFSDGEDLTSRSDEPVPWRQHTHDVRMIAEEFAARCLPGQSVAAITAAAEAHDLGKLDRRFQLLLWDGDEVEASSNAALAKSVLISERRRRRREVRADARLPGGFRHESVSVQLAEQLGFVPAEIEDRELALHLIASHHGYARPFAPVIPDQVAIELYLDGTGIDAAGVCDQHALAPAYRLDSGVPHRFWRLTRRYGWWGLPYLETILRLADWEASRKPRGGGNGVPLVRSRSGRGCSEPTTTILLEALDGANPLAFLAALGTLRLLTRVLPGYGIRMSWQQLFGAWRPLLWTTEALDEGAIATATAENGLDLAVMFSDELLRASEAAGPKNKKGAPSWKDKLLFPLMPFRDFCRAGSASPSPCAEFAAAWAGETAPTEAELARRTRFDFTAGPQAFIAMLRELRSNCRAADMQRSLFSGWQYRAGAVSMRWDTQDEKRQYALQAVDPTNGSRNPPTADSGANFLAVEALPLFPLVPDRQSAQAGFDRKGRCWNWPIWTCPLALDTIRSLLALPLADSEEWPAWRRRAIGVQIVFQSRIVQPSGRYYRCFTPARSV